MCATPSDTIHNLYWDSGNHSDMGYRYVLISTHHMRSHTQTACQTSKFDNHSLLFTLNDALINIVKLGTGRSIWQVS